MLLELKVGWDCRQGLMLFALKGWVTCNRRIQRLEAWCFIVAEKGSLVDSTVWHLLGTLLGKF